MFYYRRKKRRGDIAGLFNALQVKERRTEVCGRCTSYIKTSLRRGPGEPGITRRGANKVNMLRTLFAFLDGYVARLKRANNTPQLNVSGAQRKKENPECYFDSSALSSVPAGPLLCQKPEFNLSLFCMNFPPSN